MPGALRDVDVLVTGATGFLGSHLTRRLVADGARVHAFVRKDSSLDRLSEAIEALRVWEGDLRDPVSVERCLDGSRPRVVFHTAGFTGGREWHDAAEPELLGRSYEVNLTGTVQLLLAMCRSAPRARLVRIGGLEEYGRGSLPYREQQREAPSSAYSSSQVAGTHLAEMFHRRFGLPVVTLRPALIYGPQQAPTFFIPALIMACLANGRFDMTAGDHTRDFVYVDDAVDACIRSAVAPGIDGQVINVGSGREYRIRDVARLVVTLTGGHPDLRTADADRRAGDIERLVCDSSLAKHVLGWEARTSMEDGLAQTISWYRHRKASVGTPPIAHNATP